MFYFSKDAYKIMTKINSIFIKTSETLAAHKKKNKKMLIVCQYPDLFLHATKDKSHLDQAV